MNDKISILIPVYNAQKYLKRCLESVINQTYKNIEIILIDDGSVDQSFSICQEYALRDSRIIIKHKQNEGAATARNVALSLASGTYIMFVDSDDYIDKRYVEILYKMINKYNCEISQCNFEKGSLEKYNFPESKQKIKLYNKIEALQLNIIKSLLWGKLYKKELFNNIQFPNGKKYEDDYVIYKVVYNANNIVITSQKLYYYYMSKGSLMRNDETFINEDFYGLYRERIKFFKDLKEKDLYQVSIERFCICLMIFYIRCKSNAFNTNNIKHALSTFRKYAKRAIRFKTTKLTHKIILCMFSIFPNISARFVNKFKLYQ